jgi:hypothetical protein
MILLQNDVGIAFLLGFAKVMQYPSKFQKIFLWSLKVLWDIQRGVVLVN